LRTPIFFAAALALSTTACGTLNPNLNYQGMGAANFSRDRRVVEKADESDGGPSAEHVVVLLDTIPEGIAVKDGIVRVADGYQHEILGKVDVTPNNHVSMIALFGFPDYESGWRKPYCYPQTVLTYATLTLWALVVPTSYPCYGAPGITEESVERKLRAAAVAAGGDLVLASVLRVGNSDKVFGAHGLIVKMDPRMRAGALKTSPAKPGLGQTNDDTPGEHL
jgi:hypothetical protein